jgi:hypothetical protein
MWDKKIRKKMEGFRKILLDNDQAYGQSGYGREVASNRNGYQQKKRLPESNSVPQRFLTQAAFGLTTEEKQNPFCHSLLS